MHWSTLDASFPPGSSQNFNTNLRRIAQESGLFDAILEKPATDEHGNWRTIKTPQWEQLTSHTARRTFATLPFSGTLIKVVMNITGHSTEREFNKYVNISEKECRGLCQLLELGEEVVVHSLAALTRHPERNEQKNRLLDRCSCGRHSHCCCSGIGTMHWTHWARNSTSNRNSQRS